MSIGLMTDTPPKPKRRRWRWLAYGCLVLAIFGSSITAWYTVGPGSIFKNVPHVKKGQTREEIVQLLGEPDARRWRKANMNEPADMFSYGEFRENIFIDIVYVSGVLGVDPPEIVYPGFDLEFDSQGRFERVTSQSLTVVKMFDQK
jgi:hypothetical protein